MFSVELHCHSDRSYDGRDPVDDLLEQAATVGLDAVAVTDHDDIEGSLAAVERAPVYDLVGIPGIEISTAAGHVIGLGIESAVPPALSFGETVARIHDAGGLVVVPHPFQELRHGVIARVSRDELATADAIEVYNSRLLTGRANRQARRFAREHDIPMTAGSDAHIATMVGRAVTKVDPDEPTVEAILTEIRRGRTVVEGHRTPWHVSARQFAGGVQRRVARRLRGSGE